LVWLKLSDGVLTHKKRISTYVQRPDSSTAYKSAKLITMNLLRNFGCRPGILSHKRRREFTLCVGAISIQNFCWYEGVQQS
jgi:hypothetical protein